MSKLYLKNYYYQQLPPKKQEQPRERFYRCYADLAKLENKDPVDEETYLSQMQYNYAELGDSVLKKFVEKNSFAEIDLFVVCYWSHEHDPVHACGAYFCNNYGIGNKTRTFDICDQGILSPLMALKIIASYFANKQAKNAVLLCVDQPTIPTAKNFCGYKPKKASALALLLESEQTVDTKLVVDSVDLVKPEKVFNFEEDNLIKIISQHTDHCKLTNLSCPEIFMDLLTESEPNSAENYFWRVDDLESDLCAVVKGRFLN